MPSDADLRRWRVRLAWLVLAVTFAGWPLSAWWVWSYMNKFSPFEQLMLLLSFAALWVVGADFLTTAQVHQQAGESGKEGDGRGQPPAREPGGEHRAAADPGS